MQNFECEKKISVITSTVLIVFNSNEFYALHFLLCGSITTKKAIYKIYQTSNSRRYAILKYLPEHLIQGTILFRVEEITYLGQNISFKDRMS